MVLKFQGLFVASALGRQALTAANDGLVTRISLGSSPSFETRDFHSLYRQLGDARLELSSLSLPLTHPDSSPAAAPAVASSTTRTTADARIEAEDELFLFQRGRTRACFEAKFVDTAGQIAVAALEPGFLALVDFR